MMCVSQKSLGFSCGSRPPTSYPGTCLSRYASITGSMAWAWAWLTDGRSQAVFGDRLANHSTTAAVATIAAQAAANRCLRVLATVGLPGYRALVLLATFGSLRFGELAALRRKDIDLDAGVVRIERSLTELTGGGYHFGPPKSAAGRRVVAIPDIITPDLSWHLARFTADDDDALVFTSPTGQPLRHGNFRRRVWLPALTKAGLTGVHFHDLRHTGNDFAAGTGATLREMMDRMGHSSTRAALIYMHASDARQRQIADSLSELARQEITGQRPGRASSGTQRARKQKRRS